MKSASKFLIKIPKDDGLFEEHTIESVDGVCKFLKISNYTFYSILSGECKYQLPTTKHLKNYQIIPLNNNTTEEITIMKKTIKQKTQELKQQKNNESQLKNEFIQQNINQFNEFIKTKKV